MRHPDCAVQYWQGDVPAVRKRREPRPKSSGGTRFARGGSNDKF